MSTRGFTLIEILIALAVFAILATITSSAIYNAFNTHSHITKKLDDLNTLQLALTFVSHDTEQFFDRKERKSNRHLAPAIIGHASYFEFTRGGLINPSALKKQSTLQRIAYICTRDGQLIRRSWKVTDSSRKNDYNDKLLINQLDSCNFSYLSHHSEVLSDWHTQTMESREKLKLPAAIKLSLSLRKLGDISVLFPIHNSTL